MSKSAYYGYGLGSKILDFEAQLYQEMVEAEQQKAKYGKYNLKRAQIRWGAVIDLMNALRMKTLGEMETENK